MNQQIRPGVYETNSVEHQKGEECDDKNQNEDDDIYLKI
jgi:hypothetical protein